MDDIIFWSIADNAKISVPRNDCKVETITTPRGDKRRLVAQITGTSGKIRKLSKFVKEDFVL